jgi:hypothetical protein
MAKRDARNNTGPRLVMHNVGNNYINSDIIFWIVQTIFTRSIPLKRFAVDAS